MTEQLHRCADDVVAALSQEPSRDGRIDASRHCDEHSFLHGQLAAARSRAFRTRAGKTSATLLTQDSVVRAPMLMRTAADARSGGTPIARRTCDGDMLPL